MGNLLFLPVLYREEALPLPDGSTQAYIVPAGAVTSAAQLARLEEHGVQVGIPFQIPRADAVEGGGEGAGRAAGGPEAAIPVSCLSYSLTARALITNIGMCGSNMNLREGLLDMYVGCRPSRVGKDIVNAYVYLGAPQPDLTDGDSISILNFR